MSRPKQRIYTEADWKAADPIDRLYMHLVEPERWTLTFDEDEKLDTLRKVWTIICKKTTPRARIKLISQHVSVTERSVHRYINDAMHLFGDMLRVDMDLEFNLAYARLMKLHEKAKEANDFETARRCLDNALVVLEKIDSRAPKEVKKYPTITFTNDPAALVARNAGEFIEFEDEPNLLEQQAVGVSASD